MSTKAPKGACQKNDEAALDSGSEGSENQTTHTTDVSPQPKKWQRVLRYLLFVGSLNRFQAEKAVNDHCLHSSISTLAHDHGIVFDKIRETVPCLNGRATTNVVRYAVRATPENIRIARSVLGLRIGEAG